MTLGPIMCDIQGTALLPNEITLLQHPLIGGLILFSRNYTSPTQLTELIQTIRGIRPEILIAVDHEGGRVQRFSHGFTKIPAMRLFGYHYENSPTETCQLATDCGWLMAAELLQYDIDFSFAPVLDMDYKNSTIIGDRAFSDDPENITTLASAFIRGMKEAGMAATGKHFPGHGFVAEDSHTDIPVDRRSFAEIQQNDLIPFAALTQQSGVGFLQGIMPAHVIYPAVDQQPAGFSTRWLQDILRQQLGFQGVIFSDDLSMEGASFIGNMAKRAEAAFFAGCDMILVCNQPKAVPEVIDAVQHYPTQAAKNLSIMQRKPTENLHHLSSHPRWQETVAKLERFKQLYAEDFLRA